MTRLIALFILILSLHSCEKESLVDPIIDNSAISVDRISKLKNHFEKNHNEVIQNSIDKDCWKEDRITPYTVNPDWTNVIVVDDNRTTGSTGSTEVIYKIGLLYDDMGINTLARSTYLVLKEDIENATICGALVLKEWDIQLETNYSHFSGGVVYLDEDGGYTDMAWFENGEFRNWLLVDESKSESCDDIGSRGIKCPKFGKSWWQKLLNSVRRWFKDGGPNQNGSGSTGTAGGWSGGSFIGGNPWGNNSNNGDDGDDGTNGGSGAGSGSGSSGGTEDGVLFSDDITILHLLATQLSNCDNLTIEAVLYSINQQFPDIFVSGSTTGFVGEGADPFVSHFMYNIGSAFQFADQQTVDDLLNFVEALSCTSNPSTNGNDDNDDDDEETSEESACIKNIREFELKHGLDLTKAEILLLKGVDPCGSEGFNEDEAWKIIVENITGNIESTSTIETLVKYIINTPDKKDALEYYSIIAELKTTEPEIRWDRALEIYNIINSDNTLNDCLQGIDLATYQELLHFIIPWECEDYLNSLGEGFENQPVDNGTSAKVNLDYYGVEITSLPLGYDETELLNAIKNNFLDLASGSESGFTPSCPLGPSTDVWWDFQFYSENEQQKWNSENELTTIFLIDAGATHWFADYFSDPGAVITSQDSECCWVFSTIQTPESGSQPLSGNRQFGFRTNVNGNLEFYTRAVDRARLPMLMHVWSSQWEDCGDKDYFDIGESTWANLQSQVKSFIVNLGGEAEVLPPSAAHIDLRDLFEKLKWNSEVTSINCN